MTATSDRDIRPAEPGTLTGKHVLMIFGAFFAIVITTDLVLVYRAVSTFGGIETPDAYRRGLAYNDRLDAEARQASLGWSEKVAFDPATGRLRAAIAGRDGQGVDGLAVEAVIGRAASNAYDRKLVMTADGRGGYVADFAGLEPGNWVVSLAARKPGSDDVVFRSKTRLWRAP